MYEVYKTDEFEKWFKDLRDTNARARISIRIDRIKLGNLGDTKGIGDGVMELRIDCGPGYRLYCTKRGSTIILLLIGGNKSTQAKDVEKAKKLNKEYN
jgi:putative addiction module killer protein